MPPCGIVLRRSSRHIQWSLVYWCCDDTSTKSIQQGVGDLSSCVAECRSWNGLEGARVKHASFLLILLFSLLGNVSRNCTDEGWADMYPAPYAVACGYDANSTPGEEVCTALTHTTQHGGVEKTLWFPPQDPFFPIHLPALRKGWQESWLFYCPRTHGSRDLAFLLVSADTKAPILPGDVCTSNISLIPLGAEDTQHLCKLGHVCAYGINTGLHAVMGGLLPSSDVSWKMASMA